MEGFDPAINYGPNDAGISSFTIIGGILGIIFFTWLVGKAYTKVIDFIEKIKEKK